MIILKWLYIDYILRSLLLGIVTSYLLLAPFKVSAQDATFNSQMLTASINISGTASSKITGSVDLNNNSERGFDNYYLVIKLLSSNKSTVSGTGVTKSGPALMTNFVKMGPFTINPGQIQSQKFEINYPSTLASADYLLTAEVIDQDSSSQSIAASNINLNGSGDFLDINPSGCKILVDGISYDYFEGPNIKPSQEIYASCLVNNTAATPARISSNLQYAVNSVSLNSDTSKLIGGDQTVIESGQSKTISFKLPTSLQPQVYEGLFYLTSLTGERVSLNIPFRWIVTGPSATIYNLDLDKTYYSKGSVAKLSIGITPSADLSWRGTEAPLSANQGTDIDNARLNLKITSKTGQLCSQSTETLPSTSKDASWSNLIINMKIDRDCLDPIVEAVLMNNDETTALAEKKLSLTSTETDLKSANEVARGLPSYWILLSVAVLAFSSIAAVVYYFKFRKKEPPPGGPSLNSSAPIIGLLILCSTILTVIGYLTDNNATNLLNKIPFTIARAQEVVKQPINSSDVNTKNITVKSTWGGDRLSDWATFWGNARDFRQNNTGGDSEIFIEPDCSKINITVKGTAGSDFACYNWAPGLTVFPFIDNQSVKPENPVSPIGNEIWPTPYDFANSNNFSIMQFDSNGQRQATFSITPNAAQSADGNHSLTLQVGVSHIVKHDRVEHFQSSFINTNDCGGVPCYMLLKYDFTCRQPLACNAPCSNKDECAGNKDGCVECRPGSGDNATGSGTVMTCQPPPPPACNSYCSTNADCIRNTEGCTACVAGQCRIPSACNVSCTKNDHCADARDGCTECLPDSNGNGSTCQPPTPVCGDSCTSDSQCSRAVDGCTACVDGTCRIPPACGTACTSKAECSGAKDGCTECLEGSCTDYNTNMCKCDGIVAELDYPNNFRFEAYGKVEGADRAKAEIADITFRLTQDNQVVAKSNPITPTKSEEGDKIRFKAAWQTPPPPVNKNSTYRVFADVRCKPKRITSADASKPVVPIAQTQEPASSLPAPKGLVFLTDLINKAFGGNGEVKAFTGKVLAQMSSPSPSSQTGSNLQLKTLNFVKLMDTDNCRFVMFKFDESLF